MNEHWPETPEAAARRRLREDEARQAGEDLARTAATPEGFRVLLRLLDRWGAEAPASPDPAALALRNEAEVLLARLAEVHPGACLRLVAELRGLVMPDRKEDFYKECTPCLKRP